MPRYFFAAVPALLLSSAFLFAAEPAPKSGKHLFILSGQSNMRPPLPEAFEQTVSRVFGADKVLVVTKSIPSQPIKSWCKTWVPPEGQTVPESKDPARQNGWLYDDLMAQVKKRIAGQHCATVTFIWMQGEEDARAGWAAVYEQSFMSVLGQLKKDLGIEQINFVLGRINDYWLPSNKIPDGDRMRELQVKMAESTPRGAWVNTDDLNTGVNPWGGYELEGGHYPTPAYRVMGQRFARQACKLIDPALKLDEALFDAVFLDSATNIKSHGATGKKISGTASDQEPPGTTGGLDKLLDGQFGSADSADKKWLTYSKALKELELVVDLGGKQKLSGVGVNLLYNPDGAPSFPKKLSFYSSENGTDFNLIGKSISFSKKTNGVIQKPLTQTCLAFIEVQNTEAQYIKVKLETDNASVSLDEIVINPLTK